MKQFFLKLLVGLGFLIAFSSVSKAQDKAYCDSILMQIAWPNCQNNELDSAIYYAQLGLDLSESLGYKRGIDLGNSFLGNAYNAKGQLHDALYHFRKSLEIRLDSVDSCSISNQYQNIGDVYRKLGLYKQASEFLFQCVKLRENRCSESAIATAYNMLGSLFADQQKHDQALEYHQNALETFIGLNDSIALARTFIYIGNDFYHIQGYDSALAAYQKAIPIFNILESLGYDATSDMGIINHGLGAVYYDQENWDKANSFFKASLSFYEKDSLIEGEASAMTSLGKVALKKRKYSEALSWTKKALSNYEKAGALENIHDVLIQLNEILTVSGDSGKALLVLQSAMTLRDSLSSDLEHGQIAELEILYESEKAKREKDLIAEAMVTTTRERNFLILFSILSVLLIGVITYAYFTIRKSRRKVRHEKQKSENLLLNVLPHETSEELKKYGKVKPRYYDNVTVVVMDIVGFTMISGQISPKNLVEQLNICFSAFDEICASYQLEKIKTIGDAYMYAGGIPRTDPEHPVKCIKAAEEMLSFMEIQRQNQLKAGLPLFHLRVGIHTGPVVAGIVGKHKFAYDIWGETVNTAFRVESAGDKEKINISNETFQRIKFEYNCTARGRISIKHGKEMEMFFIESLKRGHVKLSNPSD